MPGKNQIHNLPDVKEYRRRLRNNLTPAEAILWRYLQRSQLEGRKFRRQHSVKKYILDFYCPSEKLVIELDGAHHFTDKGISHDEKRTRFLNEMGLRVVRFENDEVLYHIDAVLEKIKFCFNK